MERWSDSVRHFASPHSCPFRLANAYAIIGTWKRKSLSHRGTARSAAQPLYGSRACPVLDTGALPWCSIRVPFWPRRGSVHVPIVFRKGPANHHYPATKRNIMEQNGTHFSAQPSIVRPKRPPPTCLRAPSLGPRLADRRGPSTVVTSARDLALSYEETVTFLLKSARAVYKPYSIRVKSVTLCQRHQL